MTKKVKKVTKRNFKVCLLGGTILALLLIMFVLFSKGYDFKDTFANPDYICVKDVPNPPCEIPGESACGDWFTSGAKAGTRECNGTKYYKKYYLSLRIGCTEGGRQYRRGSRNGASGRHSTDINLTFNVSSVETAKTENCTLIQEDHNSPSWYGYGDVVNP